MLVTRKRLKFIALGILTLVLVTLGIHLNARLQPAVEVHVIDNSATNPPVSFTSISIGAYNIAHGRGNGSEIVNDTGEPEEQRNQRLVDINTLIASDPPTFLILNECDFDTYWSHQTFQPKHIGKGIYQYAITQSNYRARLWWRTWNFGNAILTNLKPVKTELVSFTPLKKSESFVGNHDALLAYFKDTQGNKLRLLAVHLEVRSKETRIRAAKKILEIQKQEDSPLFVAGDFNSQLNPSQETAMNVLLAESDPPFLSAIPTGKPHHTFPSKNPDRRIDWILMPEGYSTHSFKTKNTPLSDHAYIEATLNAQ